MWPFGTDQTCLARIQPGSRREPTPAILQYGNKLVIKKFRGNVDPKHGWARINQEQFRILSQERNASGLPVIAFMPDPGTEKAQAARRASQRAQLQSVLGVDIDGQVAEAARVAASEAASAASKATLEMLVAHGLVDPEKLKGVVATPTSSPEPAPEVEVEEEGEEEYESLSTAPEVEEVELAMDVDEEEVEVPVAAAPKKSTRRRSGKRRVSLADEG